MFVAISQRNMKIENGNRDALENTYVRYFEKFGVTLLPIPNVSENLDNYFDKIPIKAIILSSGNDVNPQLYNARLKNEDFSIERDKTEKRLIELSIKRKLPLLGICRGMQFINVYFGGSLIQNVKDKTGISHVAITHSIRITDNRTTEFMNIKSAIVNSYHNQGIDENSLSPKLKYFTITNDGIIEGLYHPKYPIAGILWHPERANSDKKFDKKIVKAFLNKKLFWGEK